MKTLFIITDTDRVERFGMMYLAAMLKKHGHSARLLRAAFKDFSSIMEEIRRYDPSILCYSVMTGEQGYYINFNRAVKSRHKAFSVFGGPHPTFFPDMIEQDGVDAVCIGEGEYPMLELADSLEHGRPVEHIKNLWVKAGGRITKNEPRPLIDNLDEIPFADRDFLYEGDPVHAKTPYRTFLASRGCPHRCTYCFNHSYNKIYEGKGRVVRRRSPENVLREIEEVKKDYPLDAVHFVDDAFLVCRDEWMYEFTSKYKQRIGLPFSCNFRPNYITEETVKKIKDAGCRWGWIGIECANEDVANKILKRNLTNKQILNACSLLKKHGIRFATQNLNGLPVDDPLAVDIETLRFNLRLKPDFAWSSILYPYPDTEIAAYARELGYFGNDYDAEVTNNKSFSLLQWKNRNAKVKVENLHKIFGVLVEFPFLIPLGRFLIRFKSLRGVFTPVYYCWYGYCHTFRLKRMKLSFSQRLNLVKGVFLYIRRLKTNKLEFNLREKKR